MFGRVLRFTLLSFVVFSSPEGGLITFRKSPLVWHHRVEPLRDKAKERKSFAARLVQSTSQGKTTKQPSQGSCLSLERGSPNTRSRQRFKVVLSQTDTIQVTTDNRGKTRGRRLVKKKRGRDKTVPLMD